LQNITYISLHGQSGTNIAANKSIERMTQLITSFSSALLVLCPAHECISEATYTCLQTTKQQ